LIKPARRAAARGVAAEDGRGTVGWLINLYKKSCAWCEEISQEMRNMRGPFLRRMEEEADNLPLHAITRAKIKEGIPANAPRPLAPKMLGSSGCVVGQMASD
jgi:hypothetical protein